MQDVDGMDKCFAKIPQTDTVDAGFTDPVCELCEHKAP